MPFTPNQGIEKRCFLQAITLPIRRVQTMTKQFSRCQCFARVARGLALMIAQAPGISIASPTSCTARSMSVWREGETLKLMRPDPVHSIVKLGACRAKPTARELSSSVWIGNMDDELHWPGRLPFAFATLCRRAIRPASAEAASNSALCKNPSGDPLSGAIVTARFLPSRRS